MCYILSMPNFPLSVQAITISQSQNENSKAKQSQTVKFKNKHNLIEQRERMCFFGE